MELITMFTIALNFTRKAEAALNFYAKVFGYEVRDTDVDKGENGLIIHAELTICGNRLMLSDTEEETHFAGFTLAIVLSDIDEIKRIYTTLSDKAEIIIPLAKVDFSECYGVLKDKFGVTWQICVA